MFRIKRDRTPLTVVVTGNCWNAYGPPTPRSARLYAFLETMGGINHSVSPGTYNFNVKRRGFKLIASLYPQED